MRVFIAVFPPSEVQRTAERATQTLKGVRDAVSWVRADNLHYTMRFLGELDDAAVERAKLAMTKAAAAQPRFGAALGGFGAFPTAKKARVLWVGMLQGAEPMRLLATALDHELHAQRFERADDAFEPHLTLGRVRTPSDWTTRLIDAQMPEARFQVDRLWLVNSTLGAGGSRYEKLAEVLLG